jgi:3-oxoadipate enol-lactonase
MTCSDQAPGDPGPGFRETGRLRVDGAQIHYEVCGQGPAIVFAHGLGGNHMSWWQQVGHFRNAFTCITFSHRGFAPSSVDVNPPDPHRYADDLAALIGHLKLGPVCLVGQSMGGWTVVEYCIRNPERVRGLVLSATVGSIALDRIAGLEPTELAAWHRSADESVTQCRAQQVHPAAGLRMAREQPAMHLLYQQIDEQARALDKEALRGRLRDMRVRTPADLAASGVALLMISPQEDIVIPPPALRALAREVPGARLVELAHTGHSPYFENARLFNHHLEDFLRNIDRDRQPAAIGPSAAGPSSLRPPRTAS